MSNNKIVIIDYKMGNLRSVQKAFEKMGSEAIISNNPEVINASSKIVLPGVGSFSDGMKNLREMGLIPILEKEILHNKKPFLGICLGMQLLANSSLENGKTAGLGWIDANVVPFDFSKEKLKLKVPHVGWNNVNFIGDNKIFYNIDSKSDLYFVHSYHFIPNEDVAISLTDHGLNFVSSVNKNNIYGFQFHPEKSQAVGLQMIENFLNL